MTIPHAPNRVAKSCSAWTDADLCLCNLKIVDTDVPTFFGIQRLPAPSVSPVVLCLKGSPSQPTHSHTALTNEERVFFASLQAASVPSDVQDAAIRDFTSHLLRLLGYTQPHSFMQQTSHERRVVLRDYDLPLYMCGRTVHALADVCLLSRNTFAHHGSDTVLLIANASPTTRSSTTNASASCAEARLVAQAIAAYQYQNRTRGRAHLLPAEKHVVPGLIMVGTMPVLYKIEITAELVECVQTGQVPRTTTKVQRLRLPLKGSAHKGMIAVENRKVMLACLEAFKAFV